MIAFRFIEAASGAVSIVFLLNDSCYIVERDNVIIDGESAVDDVNFPADASEGFVSAASAVPLAVNISAGGEILYLYYWLVFTGNPTVVGQRVEMIQYLVKMILFTLR